MRRARLFPFAALAVGLGCLDQTPFGSSDPAGIPAVGIIPATLYLEPGGSVVMVASSALVQKGPVRWETEDSTIATVDDNGFVTAIRVGTTRVRASNSRGSARSSITVVPRPARIQSWRVAELGLTDASLLGYWSADADMSFAVGTGGTILQTQDGGVTWRRMVTPDTTHLVSVWGFSRTNVYAVGNSGTVLHYDGSSWTRIPTGSDRTLLEVWGLSPTEIYAVGDRVALRFDGTAWHPLTGSENAELWAVWGPDPAHIFASGQNGVLFHLSGTHWEPLQSPTNLLLLGLWGTGPENVFAVGVQGTVLRWNGAEWTRMTTPTRQDLFAVWGKSGTEVVAVGDNGTMLLFNGADWNLLPQTATGENLRAVHAAPNGTFGAAGWDGTILRRSLSGNWQIGTSSPLLFDAARLGGSGLFAVGVGGAVLLQNQGGWIPLPIPTQRTLYGVARDGAQLVAVGDLGTIKRFDGTGWQDESYPAQWLLRSIWLDSTGQGFIVGDRGIILQRVGTRWVEMPPPQEVFLRHVFGFSRDQVYAVGDSGTAMTWNGRDWRVMPTPTDSLLRRIWGSGPDNVFAVGAGGTILRFDGVQWYRMPTPTTKDLRTIWGAGPTDIYAAGEDGVLLQFDGSRWVSMPSPTKTLLLSFEYDAGGDPVLVGARGIRLEAVR